MQLSCMNDEIRHCSIHNIRGGDVIRMFWVNYALIPMGYLIARVIHSCQCALEEEVEQCVCEESAVVVNSQSIISPNRYLIGVARRWRLVRVYEGDGVQAGSATARLVTARRFFSPGGFVLRGGSVFDER